MKKALSLLIGATLVATSVFSVSVQAGSFGDINGDGKIDAADALLALQHSVQLTTLDSDAFTWADVNDDRQVNASDALAILQHSVGLIKEFDVSLTPEERYYKARDLDYGADYSDFTDVVSLENYNDAAEVKDKLGGSVEASSTDSYDLNDEYRLVYNRLSKDVARQMDAKYQNAEKVTGTVEAGGTRLTYSIPKNVSAYDCVPIDYSLTSTSVDIGESVYVEATGYEETARTPKEQDYFDCTLPGDISVDFEYLGYVNGTMTSPSTKPQLALNPDDDIRGTAYPPFDTTEERYSGTVEQGDYTWFHFRYTNTGNTVLDLEGNGGFNFYCQLQRKNREGKYETQGTTSNEWQPLLDYLYPGESGEMWLVFNHGSKMATGDYRIVVTGKLKNSKAKYNYSDTLLYATTMTRARFPFTISRYGDITEPEAVTNQSGLTAVSRCGWIGTFEEFLTSYQSHLMVSDDASEPTTSRMYLQVASFTEQIGLKLINGDGDEIGTAQIPVSVNTDDIQIKLNPFNENYHVKEDGTRTPLIITQNMADMRGAADRGPDCASTIVNELRNMKEAGINYITTTESATGDYSGVYDMTAFMLDSARQMGFDEEGHALYPYRNPLAETRLKVLDPTVSLSGKTDIFGVRNADEANGLLARINLIRYGDLYYSTPKGILPISLEDNFGWLGFYINGRYALGSNSFNPALRQWLTNAYGSIGALNAAYGSNYASFNDINPAAEGQQNSIGIDSNNPSAVYHDWTAATAEMDLFRTVERMNYYKTMLDAMDVEEARLNIRSENAIYLAPGISPNTTNPHYRSCYYEQRRAALVPEILIASGIVFGDSSYTTLAYTPSEVYELTRQAAKHGLNTTKTADFHMSMDNVVNPSFGSLDSNRNYNISDDLRICNIVSTTSLFTYWKALYEAGGVPGTMWMDYCCDTLVTSTQYKEMLFFQEKINEMLATEEGRAWATDFEPAPRNFESIVKGAYSFPEEYISEQLATIPRYNRITQQHSRISK